MGLRSPRKSSAQIRHKSAERFDTSFPSFAIGHETAPVIRLSHEAPMTFPEFSERAALGADSRTMQVTISNCTTVDCGRSARKARHSNQQIV
jgi:hypothetical protein